MFISITKVAGQWVQIDALGMFISITKVVIVPILLGGICHRFFSKLTEKGSRYKNRI